MVRRIRFKKSRGVKATITCVKNGNAVSYEGLSPRAAARAGREQVINEKITNYTTKSWHWFSTRQ